VTVATAWRWQAQPRVVLSIVFWTLIAVALLLLTGVQFGPAATLSILAVTVTKATPITLGALAGICSERSGVVNIGIEGLMLTSAFMGFMVGVYTHDLMLGLLAAVASGALLALLHAALSIGFRVD
jgi:simple sugar transport system permease protein